jgi:hypothetical protein
MNGEKILIGVFVGVEGAHAFSAFMPSFFTIKAFAHDAQDAARLRSGYTPATVFNLVLGGAVSALLRSGWPLLMSIAVSALMISAYESAINEATGQPELPASSTALARQ